jgi:hypothetical protein
MVKSVQWLDDQRGKTDLYCFCLLFFAIIDLQQGKTLKNVALDILGKIIGGGVCSITVAFDF